MIKFQARYLPMLFPFMAKKDVRYYLNGVYIEPAEKGVYLVATDGHKMAVIHDTEGECDEARIFSVRRDALRFCKGGAPYAPFVTIDPAPQRLMVSDPVEERYLQPGKCFVGGTFPEFRRVLPEFDKLIPGSPSTINSAYLAEIAYAAPKQLGWASIRLWSVGGVDPVTVIQFDSAPEMVGLVMPVRGNDELRFTDGIKQVFTKGK